MINLAYNGQTINQRESDGYINATQMCYASGTGKKIADWSRLKESQDYIAYLSSDMGIPASQLVISIKGNSSQFSQGTWIHPDLAICLGRWISVEFAVWCDRHIKKYLETGRSNGRLNTDWFGRIVFFRKHSQIPIGYFSVFEELTHSLISDFEAAEYKMPDRSGIDISAGRCWSDYAKAHYPNIDNIRIKCKHHYPDERGAVNAFAYQDSLLPDFRKWLEYNYKIDHLYTYLKRKDPRAIEILSNLLQIQLPGNLFDLKLLN